MNPRVRYISIRLEIEGKQTPDELREIVRRTQAAALRAGASGADVLDPAPAGARPAGPGVRPTRAPSRRSAR